MNPRQTPITSMPQEKISIDAPLVSRDMATELVAHHLGLAAAYFEASPEGPEPLREIERLLAGQIAGYDPREGGYLLIPPQLIAARAWLKAIYAAHEEMKGEFPE